MVNLRPAPMLSKTMTERTDSATDVVAAHTDHAARRDVRGGRRTGRLCCWRVAWQQPHRGAGRGVLGC
jgi:hypothetical protein